MSKYIDGFVLPLPKDKIVLYQEISTKCGAIWKEHGALEYVESVGDDLDIKDQVSFSTLAGAGSDETVVFAYIVYQSREHRDAVNAKVFADPRLHAMFDPENPLFECKRMASGGFKTIVSV
jgi:uncharacterized protein YbaA (DUF1428 family)